MAIIILLMTHATIFHANHSLVRLQLTHSPLYDSSASHLSASACWRRRLCVIRWRFIYSNSANNYISLALVFPIDWYWSPVHGLSLVKPFSILFKVYHMKSILKFISCSVTSNALAIWLTHWNTLCPRGIYRTRCWGEALPRFSLGSWWGRRPVLCVPNRTFFLSQATREVLYISVLSLVLANRLRELR